MTCLLRRDKLFSALHATVLKPHGYKKKGHWITRDLGSLLHAFFLRASRFGSHDNSIFWIDVQIFSESWHDLVFPERPYKGPSEGPSLVSRELGRWCNPPMHTLTIAPETDVETLLAQLCLTTTERAIPYLAQRQSPSALLTMLKAEPEVGTELSLVGLARLLGLDEEARQHMQLAKQNAAHESYLRFLELRERNIWRNAA